MELFRWSVHEDSGWSELGGDRYRPDLFHAVFRLGGDEDQLVVEVDVSADSFGVGPLSVRFVPAGDTPLRSSDYGRFDSDAAMAVLSEEAVVAYKRDGTGRPRDIRFGSAGAWVPISDVRRCLSPPDEPVAKPGPKAKAEPYGVAQIARGALDRGESAAQAVADELGLSVSSAHRYIARARKAGLLTEGEQQ